jgi:hypothetical protein
MKIFDSTIHSPDSAGWTIAQLDEVVSSLETNKITAGNLIYFLSRENVALETFIERATESGVLGVVACVNPLELPMLTSLGRETLSKLVGLKLHPRVNEHDLDKSTVGDFFEATLDYGVPYYLCTFDDGKWAQIGVEVKDFVRLALNYPSGKFIWAHSGGHRVMEMMMSARRLENVYLETSFTPNYFRFGTVRMDFAYALWSFPRRRWLLGSDFPSFSQIEAIDAIGDIIRETPELLSEGPDFFSSTWENSRELFAKTHVYWRDYAS